MSEYIYATNGNPVANENGEISLARNEIVRCGDCASYQPDMYKHFTCEHLNVWAMPDDFCAWGERR